MSFTRPTASTPPDPRRYSSRYLRRSGALKSLACEFK